MINEKELSFEQAVAQAAADGWYDEQKRRIQQAIRIVAKVDHGDFAEAVNAVAGAMMYFNITMQAASGQWLDEWLANAHSHINGGETIAQLVEEWNAEVEQAKG